MSIQLDERPTQVLTSPPDDNEPPNRRSIWIVAATAVVVLTLGVGAIVAVAHTGDAPPPAGEPHQADAAELEVNGGVLPAHLQEFEARSDADSPDAGALPAHLQEFEARTDADSPDAGALPAHLQEFEARTNAHSPDDG